MRITKEKEKEIRELRKFLRERKLTAAFKRSRKIKQSKKFDVDVDGNKKSLIAFKRKGRLIIADRFTLKTLATTKRFNLRNIDKGFKPKLIRSVIKGKETARIVHPIQLKEIRKQHLKNVDLTERSSPLRKKVGKIYMSVTFSKGKFKKTVEGGSRKEKFLYIASERQKAYDEAFKGAMSQINFSYDKYIINWVHYAYLDRIGR